MPTSFFSSLLLYVFAFRWSTTFCMKATFKRYRGRTTKKLRKTKSSLGLLWKKWTLGILTRQPPVLMASSVNKQRHKKRKQGSARVASGDLPGKRTQGLTKSMKMEILERLQPAQHLRSSRILQCWMRSERVAAENIGNDPWLLGHSNIHSRTMVSNRDKSFCCSPEWHGGAQLHELHYAFNVLLNVWC